MKTEKSKPGAGRRWMIWLAAGALTGPAPLCWAAGATVVTVSLEQNFDAPRWMYDQKVKVRGPKLTQLMVAAKRALQSKDRGACVGAIEKSYALGKGIGPWLALTQLQCAQLKDRAGKPSPAALVAATSRVDAQPRWLLTGPASAPLRSQYVGALLMLAEAQSKSDRTAAWKAIDKLVDLKTWMSAEDRANTYRWAGELAFVEQNLAAALDFLTRSLSEKDSAEIRARVESIRSSLLKKKVEAQSQVQTTAKSDDVGISDEERDLTDRMNRAYESKDYLSAVEDAIQLLQKFPGSRRSIQAADLVLDVYLAIANRTDEKLRNARASVVKEMEKADAGRLNRWANNAYARGNYQDALTLAEKSCEKYAGQVEGTKVLLLAGKAALAAGEYIEAQGHFDSLMKLHGGTPEAAEAAFRLGLLEYRRKHYAQASALFERVLALNSGADFEYRSYYWQWRSQQKVDSAKAVALAQSFAAKYPFSYYGLRAQAELNNGELKIGPTDKPIKIEIRLLGGEKLAWERFLVLLRAGWFKEAEKELDLLPEPQSAEERLIRARFWALALRYDLAIQEVSRAIEERPELARTPVLNVVFPREYAAWIDREGKAANVSANWVRSLMRQESSFRPDVKSPSNAHGLMQILPTVGAELARDLRMKDFQGAESLLNPEINIKIGSYYLARLIRNFNGNIPLALAAYNAGPTRLRRWLSARKDLSPLESTPSSSPDVEIWMDELPWEETSFYVKSILRNWIIYQILDGSKLSLSEPLWVDAKPLAR